SLLCQANSHYALSQYGIAIETTEQGLRTLSALDDRQIIITKAHLLGVGADCAMMAGDHHLARQKLDKVEILLAHIKPNEEFDRGSWCQLMGKCEYLTGNYRTAAHWYERALAEVPSEWVLRRALVLTSLISTYTVLQDCEASMMAVEKAVPLPQQLQVPSMNKPLTQALQGLLIVFPYETRITTMVADLLQQIHK
ncbi:MAG: hypothetical protein J2P36_11120, partial [Ktedonobacteraceae bacterium]|nr:hypothetical protein [Ktedonobacteraceae bacterium]